MKTRNAAALGIKQLYHYQSFEKPEQLARMFADTALYFSSPRDFNDPWDCRPCYNKSVLDESQEYDRTVEWFVHLGRTHHTSLSEEEHIRREKELRSNRKLLERMIDEITSKMADTIQKQYRVYCLSTHPDSTLMWAHYAASCRGLCLEFAVQNELFCGALQIDYVHSYPRFSIAANNDNENLQPLLTKDRKSTRLNSSHIPLSRMPSSA